jgi:outer membrane protein
MDKSQRVQAAVLPLLVFCFCLAAAVSASARDLNIMVVDVQSLFQQSKAARAVGHQIDAKREEYRKEMAAAAQKLNKEKDTLQRAQGSLSPAALNKKEIKFQQEVSAFNVLYKGKAEALQKSGNEALGKIQQAILQIIRKVAQQRKADLVFQRGQLLYWDQSFDVTAEVLKQLDKELPTLAVSFSAAAPPPARPPSAAPRHK